MKALRQILASCALCAALAAPAAPVITVTAALDSAVVVMGDRNHLHVSVNIPNSYASSAQLVDFPMLTPGQEYLEYNGVDVVASDSTVTAGTDSRNVDFDFTIQAFAPGTLTLPPFAVLPAPGSDTVISNVVTLKVLPVEVDSLQTINPMASVAAPLSRWYDYIPTWVWWALAILALAAACIYLYTLLRHRGEEAEQRRTPVVPPYELAISRLNILRSRNLPETGHEKEYYTELVDILRQYLQGRFGINAMEMTSTQIVKALRSNPDTRITADMMRSVLSIADFREVCQSTPAARRQHQGFRPRTGLCRADQTRSRASACRKRCHRQGRHNTYQEQKKTLNNALCTSAFPLDSVDIGAAHRVVRAQAAQQSRHYVALDNDALRPPATNMEAISASRAICAPNGYSRLPDSGDGPPARTRQLAHHFYRGY